MQSWAKGGTGTGMQHCSLPGVTKSLVSVGKQGLRNPQLCIVDPASKKSQQKGKLLYKEPANSEQFEFSLSPVTFR